jgi:hypothetical protein
MTAVQHARRDQPTAVTLSACIIVHNEAQNRQECLAIVEFCQEIVLVDSGSTDATTEIVRAAGARVVEQPWLDFAAQRNVVLNHVTGEWVPDPPREIVLGCSLGPSASLTQETDSRTVNWKERENPRADPV